MIKYVKIFFVILHLINSINKCIYDSYLYLSYVSIKNVQTVL